MEQRIEKLKKEYEGLLKLSKDKEIVFGTPLHRSIMAEMGKLKLQIMELSIQNYRPLGMAQNI